MRLLQRYLIIAFLLPVLMMHLLYPRINRNPLFDLLARQPILVSSFVWIPLLEASVLIVEQILLPTAIEAPDKNDNTAGKQPSSPTNDIDSLAIATPNSSLAALLRKLVLPPLKFWLHLDKPLCDESRTTPGPVFPLLIILPFLNCCLLRSSLPRGDPPAVRIVG